ncbi:hypothetical protein WJX73_008624 [Symbiochloris irregularis]|uniref:Glycosyltransferase 61 catalytic domain-containing protein n=1 Tax=Symbiochloris irregularis TaxID=706552 RepID=A0AAW1PUN9_9CHLO
MCWDFEARLSDLCQCEDGGSADTRVCQITNLCIVNGKLYLLTAADVAGDARPKIPDIMVNWHAQRLARIEYLDVHQLAQHMAGMQVKYVEQGVLQHVAWANNFYHSMEALVAFAMKACQVFGHCKASEPSAQAPQLIRTEENDLGNPNPAAFDWLAHHPTVAQAMRCITQHPAPHILGLQGQITIVRSAVIGIGRSNRIYSGSLTRPGFHDIYVLPERWLVDDFRERMAQCAGAPTLVVQASDRLNISIVNRGDGAGRHMLNVQETRSRILSDFAQEIDRVRIIRPEELDFAEQLRAYATSSVIITTHSAANANLMFIPKGSAVVEYVWHKDVAPAHDWVVDLLTDMHLNCSLVGVHQQDHRLLEWRREIFYRQPKFEELSITQKLAFYENNEDLTKDMLDGLDHKFHANFHLDWAVLRPALQRAIGAIRTGNHTFNFMPL